MTDLIEKSKEAVFNKMNPKQLIQFFILMQLKENGLCTYEDIWKILKKSE
jgi:hypothetical protein